MVLVVSGGCLPVTFAYADGITPTGYPDAALINAGRELFFKETFNGNGRTCGTCHPEDNNFTIDPEFIGTLPDDDPLFVAERAEPNPLSENFEKPELMRKLGLILENINGFEDPENNFLPSPGTMSLYEEPEGDFIRVDSGIKEASEIQSFFDPMIAKLVVWGIDRESAIRKSISALNEFIVHGIKTNITYLRGVLEHPAYIEFYEKTMVPTED